MNEPQFTHDWASNNFNVWSEVLKDLKGKANISALEIGCYEGRATRWFLENVLTHPSSNIMTIDTFQGSDEHAKHGVDFSQVEERFHHNTEPWENRVFSLKGYSHRLLKQLRPHDAPADHTSAETPGFDLIYVDGSHKAADVLADGVLSWFLLRPDGILIFDDYAWDAYPDPALNPRLGIDAFLSVYASQITVLHKSYQVIIRRKL